MRLIFRMFEVKLPHVCGKTCGGFFILIYSFLMEKLKNNSFLVKILAFCTM